MMTDLARPANSRGRHGPEDIDELAGDRGVEPGPAGQVPTASVSNATAVRQSARLPNEAVQLAPVPAATGQAGPNLEAARIPGGYRSNPIDRPGTGTAVPAAGADTGSEDLEAMAPEDAALESNLREDERVFAAHVELSETAPTRDQLTDLTAALAPQAGAAGVNGYGYLTAQLQVAAESYPQAVQRAEQAVQRAAAHAGIRARDVVQAEALADINELDRRMNLTATALVPELLSSVEAADRLQVSTQRMRDYAVAGRFGAMRIGREWVFPAIWITQEQHRRFPPGDADARGGEGAAGDRAPALVSRGPYLGRHPAPERTDSSGPAAAAEQSAARAGPTRRSPTAIQVPRSLLERLNQAALDAPAGRRPSRAAVIEQSLTTLLGELRDELGHPEPFPPPPGGQGLPKGRWSPGRSEPTVQITVKFEPDLLAEVRGLLWYCHQQRIPSRAVHGISTLNELVTVAVERFLERWQEPAAAGRRGSSGPSGRRPGP